MRKVCTLPFNEFFILLGVCLVMLGVCWVMLGVCRGVCVEIIGYLQIHSYSLVNFEPART